MLHRTLTRRTALAVAMAIGVSVSTLAPERAAADEDYLLATASTGGTYYPVGVAIATLIKVKLQPKDKINVSAISSAGSGENVRLLREKEVHFAILQGLFGAYAQSGTGPVAADGPQTHLRSIAMLWPNVEHFVLLAEHAKSGTIDDMAAVKGKAVSMGAQNSGTLGSNDVILSNLGLPLSGYELAYMGYNPSADALLNGQIVAMSTPAGVPVAAVTRAFAAMGDKIRLLGFSDEQIAKANGSFKNLWVPYPIPAGTYPGQASDVTTIAQPNFLAVHQDVPEETVYKITKTIFENLGFLQAIHPATKAMSLESALGGLPMALHPGAARYFAEAGLTIPDHLKP
ncbi:MAG: TAXI family TRAP transporter solute-binding subunit [Rhizobiales bacterium]|nr:TAXI family TRAP transporter solute-binding subunit [Hyphomicrobiales bacterium]